MISEEYAAIFVLFVWMFADASKRELSLTFAAFGLMKLTARNTVNAAAPKNEIVFTLTPLLCRANLLTAHTVASRVRTGNRRFGNASLATLANRGEIGPI